MKTSLSFLSFVFALSASLQALPAIGETASLGCVEGVAIEVKVQSPSAQETPLQVVCLFEYTEGDIFTSPPALPKELNGIVHVDEALKGLITELRKTGRFEGKYLETLVIIPPRGSLPAQRLLLIGLGNRKDFHEDIMRLVGVVGMREALRLGVSSYSHASDVKDGGVDSNTGAVTGNVVKGALEALRTQRFLKERDAGDPITVTRVTVLSGPAFFEDSQAGIKKILP